ncbi:MAG: T9SS type A sorting domain-containing protein [candidate division WOR-3 bacterium]|nr:T9SS type A sorting domain-containing protein [candidate division WOR-3 bacterium]
MAWLLILSIFLATDTVEVKGKRGLSYRVFTNQQNLCFQYKVGKNWSVSAILGLGKLPCISLDKDGKPWIAYLSPDNRTLNCAVRRDDETWKRMFIFGIDAHGEYAPEYIGQPSMVHNIYPESPMAYLVCSFDASATMYDMIQFIPFDTSESFYPEPLDIGLTSDSLRNPCIGITPEDILHVVWQRKRENTQSVYYEATLDKVTPTIIYETRGNLDWSEKAQVSTQFPLTEPASNPFVEAYGDKVFVTWRGPYNETNEIGEIWRRWKELNNPWVDPENQSQSSEQESDYPVTSTGEVTAWQELLAFDNWEIYARINDTMNLSETDNASKYPHITVTLSPISPIHMTIDAIWTEEIDPDTFEVMYRRIQLPQTTSQSYYSVNVGESIPSPYLEERTGYLQYEQYKIDYGRNRLLYRLPYLNPQYDYLARAVVFTGNQNRTRQNFVFDDSTLSLIEFEPFKPETLWIKIPNVAYQSDLEVKERINRLIGNFAVLADLQIYQYEEYMGGSGEGGAMGNNIGLSLKPVLYNCLPNPFHSQTMIRYQLPNKMQVSLKVYDITGREVRNLVYGSQETGDYRIKWDAKDDEGKHLGNGIYFYSLKTADFMAIKKLVRIK